ncbi:hypothetical protein [Acinetobacter towneri]|uniref:hypothetical protein n=1 Tax=Acinetobacter towneri TaxID=202956 RepID=UPI0002D05411|nr:hypothetical protein [Acinetobacter towneri]ENV68664.1 hypothetical protein F947_02391 [Acinetobacter towneri DSM 14962 = CIP 107472]
MNTLEKSLLIKELRDLIDALTHKRLSLYETAKAKARIKEIFMLCDKPIFQKQLLTFKASQNPIQTAVTFAEQSLYAQSFCGVFTEPETLETVLYQQPEAGWAILYQPRAGWQIWLIPAADRTALLSEFQDLEQVYRWMLEQQQQYHCLQTDAELKQAAVLEAAQTVTIEAAQTQPVFVTADLEENKAVDSPIQFEFITDHIATEEVASSDTQVVDVAKDELTIEPTADQTIISNATLDITQPDATTIDTAQMTAGTQKPSVNPAYNLLLSQYSCPISALNLSQNESAQLYRVFLPEAPEVTQYADVLVHLSDPEEDQQQVLARAVYLAEQTNTQGRFIKYVVLLGALDQMQAIRLTQNFCQQFEHEIAAIREISWEKLQEHLFDFDQLFQCYSHDAQIVWQQEHYFPFIPIQHIQTTKFIQFEESEAQSHTPLILLKERQKIRVIHGQKRLQLSRTEQAIPHILLDRQQGISWQMIQKVISQLQQPIDALQLCQALQMYQEKEVSA